MHLAAENQARQKTKTDPAKEEEWHNIITVAKEKAEIGHTVEILPETHDHDLRKLILPDYKYAPKNPDYRIDGKYVELKNVQSHEFSAISDNIRKASHQADDIIINLPDLHAHKDLANLAKLRFETFNSLETIEFRHKGKYTEFKRADFLQRKKNKKGA